MKDQSASILKWHPWVYEDVCILRFMAERVLFYIFYIEGKNRRICLELCYDPHYFGYLEIFRHSRKWELT